MKSNFEFLKDIDNELFEIIEEAQNLFRSGYFNQSVIQTRIFAEKMAKKISNTTDPTQTFDNILNNLKDKIKTEREKEFIDDLFFIKKQGNNCAHGEETSVMNTLEVIRRAFEAGINYAYSKKKDENIDKLRFDDTLLITQKPKEENKIIKEYLKLAQEETKEQLLNKKQSEFIEKTNETNKDFETNLKDKNSISKIKQYKKTLPKKEEIKNKIKEAKRNLKENINKVPKKNPKKPSKTKNKKQKNNKIIKLILFLVFLVFSLLILYKMIF